MKGGKMRRIFFVFILILIGAVFVFAEDSFGFGFDAAAAGEDTAASQTENSSKTAKPAAKGIFFESADEKFSIKIGGGLFTGFPIFFNDFKKNIENINFGSLFWGNLHVTARAPVTEAYFGVRLNERSLGMNLGDEGLVFPAKPQIPRFIDEAYAQIMLGPVIFGGGIKKITWGKADALSVLDIVNPQDLSDPTISDEQKLKIARPMLYLSSYLPKDIKLEAVFLPVFEGHHIPLGGRWKPAQLTESSPAVEAAIQAKLGASLPANPAFIARVTHLATPKLFGGGGLTPAEAQAQAQQEVAAATAGVNISMTAPDTAKIAYAQGGLRFTIPIAGLHDIGIQYFNSRLPVPAPGVDESALKIDIAAGKLGAKDPLELKSDSLVPVVFKYSQYHNIGLDYAAALGPVNLRAEIAANITHDIKGTDPAVHNPFLAWNLGFDYALPHALSINILAAEKIRLLHDKIGTAAGDIEKGVRITETQLMFMLSQRLIRDSLEWRIAALVGIEDADFLIMPGVQFQYGTILFNIDAGIFGGKKTGRFGQYKDNAFLKLAVGYVF